MLGGLPFFTSIEEEPRVLDTDLAERLGMARPTNIRQLIEQNREELEGYGHVARAECNVPMPQGGFKTGTAYYLNEEQALLICALSRTEKAKKVRAMLIKVFVARHRGADGLRPRLCDLQSQSSLHPL